MDSKNTNWVGVIIALVIGLLIGYMLHGSMNAGDQGAAALKSGTGDTSRVGLPLQHKTTNSTSTSLSAEASQKLTDFFLNYQKSGVREFNLDKSTAAEMEAMISSSGSSSSSSNRAILYCEGNGGWASYTWNGFFWELQAHGGSGSLIWCKLLYY